MSTSARHQTGLRQFAEVMTFEPPDDDSPTTENLIDFVFAEVSAAPRIEPPRP